MDQYSIVYAVRNENVIEVADTDNRIYQRWSAFVFESLKFRLIEMLY